MAAGFFKSHALSEADELHHVTDEALLGIHLHRASSGILPTHFSVNSGWKIYKLASGKMTTPLPERTVYWWTFTQLYPRAKCVRRQIAIGSRGQRRTG